jgi:hypothetical protein
LAFYCPVGVGSKPKNLGPVNLGELVLCAFAAIELFGSVGGGDETLVGVALPAAM